MELYTNGEWREMSEAEAEEALAENELLCMCGGRECCENDGSACKATRLVNAGTERKPCWWAVSPTCGHMMAGEDHEAAYRSEYELDYYAGCE